MASTTGRQSSQEQSLGTTGLFLVILGSALVFVSLAYLSWYKVPHAAIDSSGNVDFSSLHSSAKQLGGAGFAKVYFEWLARVLLVAVAVCGVAATAPSPAADVLRVVGFGIGCLGAVATYYALLQHFRATGSTHFVLYNATWGVWAALGGFLIAAAGAALGPHRIENGA